MSAPALRFPSPVFLAFILSVVAAPLYADDFITLTNGRSAHGTVVEETDQTVIFELPSGKRYNLRKNTIKSIERGPRRRHPAGSPEPVESEPIGADEGRQGGVVLGFSGALTTIAGSYGGTFLANAGIQIAQRPRLQLQLGAGLLFANSFTWLPVLVSVVHQFSNSASYRPYLGLAIGPVFRLSSPSVTVGAITIPVTTTTVDSMLLAVLLRPGYAIPIGKSTTVNIEVPIGGLTGAFYVAPTVGIFMQL